MDKSKNITRQNSLENVIIATKRDIKYLNAENYVKKRSKANSANTKSSGEKPAATTYSTSVSQVI